LKKIIITILSLCCLQELIAQQENLSIRAGNKHYREKQYQEALKEYNEAVRKAPQHDVANYNQGNAQVRTNLLEDAVASYETTIGSTKKKAVKEKGYYNKGVALSKQQKLQESIEAWKNALKLDPNDQEARENLQKALLELKKQQEQQKQQEEQNKKNKKEQNKEQQKEQEQPKQQSNLSKKRVEQLLKALQQKEKEVQDRLQSRNTSPSRQEKDW
jgi:tetratricopeptide (TPR) repeat protein